MNKNNSRHRIFFRIILITLGTFVFTIALDSINFFQKAENVFYDYRIKKTASLLPPSEEIAVVFLDQNSIDWGNKEFNWGWPWKRSTYADLVHFFNLGNAASVTFDVLFTEPSVYGPEDDQKFAQACKDYGKVVQTVYHDANRNAKGGWKDYVPLPSLYEKSSWVTAMGKDPLLFPIPEIGSSCALVGNITSTSDADSTIRRAKAYYQYGDYYIPSLGIAPLFAAQKEFPDYKAEPKEGRYLRFQKDLNAYVPYSAAHILQSYYALQKGEEPLLQPEMFEDMHVFFGFLAPGLYDICTTPISSMYPGVGVHITQLDNYLQNSYLKPCSLSITLLLILLGSFVGAISLSVTELLRKKRGTIFVALSLVFFIGIIFIQLNYFIFGKGFILPLITPLFSLLLGFITSMSISFSLEGRQKRYLKSAFRQYLSPAVIEELIDNPNLLQLGGEQKEISILFSDVQGFTSISEKLSPKELTSFLNDFLSEMTDIILESGGTIDKYEGDAIIAFWNAPVNQENHPRRALEAAVRCQERLQELRPQFEKRINAPFYMRIGLNTGNAVVGNMGSRSRFDYTMLGDSVNLASRLEGLNKEFGTYCICTQTTKEKAEKLGTNLQFRELARAAVIGKTEAITIYEPLTQEEYAKKEETLSIFHQGLLCFYKGKLKEAQAYFEQIKNEDSPANNYLKKCTYYLEQKQDLENWQGIWFARSK